MRTAVYNRHWSTAGGAEKYGGVIAQVLSGDGPLDLLTHEPVDVDNLAGRLHLDLAKVDVRLVDDKLGQVTKASRDYDLFVNVSYLSNDRAATPRSLYVVHFPSALDGHLGLVRRLLARHPGRVRGLVSMEWVDGFHPRDPGLQSVVWTAGEGVLRFVTEPGSKVRVTFVIGHHRPASQGPGEVQVQVDGHVAAESTLEMPSSRLARRRGAAVSVDVESPAEGIPVEVKLVSDTFVPADVLGTDDRRRLGVPLKAWRVGTGPLSWLSHWLPARLPGPGSSAWTRSYGAVVSNSEFTQGWVQNWWGCDSEVLYPPVTMHRSGTKEPVILNVGRFFDSAHGHSKKQLELVRAFRILCDRGRTGWALHLVGGCADAGRDYFEKVREAARGYPVALHPNAGGDELEELYARASIYWHASGLGENLRRHPGRLEHFGITTVEAMSAGAVPVVIGLAGQLETVRDGVDGYHFSTLRQLCDRTESLILNSQTRDQMAQSARQRAEGFSVESFEVRLRAIVDRLMAIGPDTGLPT